MGHYRIQIDIGEKHFEALVPVEGDISFNMKNAYQELLLEAQKFGLLSHQVDFKRGVD